MADQWTGPDRRIPDYDEASPSRPRRMTAVCRDSEDLAGQAYFRDG